MCSMFRVRLLIKVTRSRLYRNCGVSAQTDSDDQLEPLNPRVIVEAVGRGLRIDQVVFISPDTCDSVSIVFPTFHNVISLISLTQLTHFQATCNIDTTFPHVFTFSVINLSHWQLIQSVYIGDLLVADGWSEF